jgi:hypothetical protein
MRSLCLAGRMSAFEGIPQKRTDQEIGMHSRGPLGQRPAMRFNGLDLAKASEGFLFRLELRARSHPFLGPLTRRSRPSNRAPGADAPANPAHSSYRAP